MTGKGVKYSRDLSAQLSGDWFLCRKVIGIPDPFCLQHGFKLEFDTYANLLGCAARSRLNLVEGSINFPINSRDSSKYLEVDVFCCFVNDREKKIYYIIECKGIDLENKLLLVDELDVFYKKTNQFYEIKIEKNDANNKYTCVESSDGIGLTNNFSTKVAFTGYFFKKQKTKHINKLAKI